MNIRTLSATVVLAASFCATTAVVASPLSLHNPVHAKFGTVKQVKFSLRNDSKEAIKVLAGTTPLTLAPGATVDAKVAVGEKVTIAEATGAHAAGDVIATVSSDLSGNTIALR